jgi:hypothetical protein
VLEKCGVVTSQMYRLERERVKRLKEEWSTHHVEMACTSFPTPKHQGPQGVRQSLKSSGRTWSATRRTHEGVYEETASDTEMHWEPQGDVWSSVASRACPQGNANGASWSGGSGSCAE